MLRRGLVLSTWGDSMEGSCMCNPSSREPDTLQPPQVSDTFVVHIQAGETFRHIKYKFKTKAKIRT